MVSYGRVGQSHQRRKIDLDALFLASGDSGASDFHNVIMKWRHGHVAHRADTAFEKVDALLSVDATLTPRVLRVVVQPEMGPQDDDELAGQFRTHVYLLRNTIWESFIAPLAAKLAERAQRKPAELGKAIPYPSTPAEGFVVTLMVWAQPECANPVRPTPRATIPIADRALEP